MYVPATLVMTRVTSALDGEQLTQCLRRVNAHGLISTTHLVVSADLLQYVSLATCALGRHVPNTARCVKPL